MPIRYTASERVRELLVDEIWKAWKERDDKRRHFSATECLEPDPYVSCESPSLRLTTFVRLGEEMRTWYDKKRSRSAKVKDNSRGEEVVSIVECCNRYQKPSPLPGLFHTVPGAERFVARLEARLIVDQAGGLIENGSLRLHSHFGYPFIPGSAVKGVARHAAWEEWKGLPDGDKKKEVAKKIAIVFGFPTGDAKAKKSKDEDEGRVYLDDYLREKFPNEITEKTSFGGSIVFFSAEPLAGEVLLEEDILTPHTRSSPIPNAFPVVKSGNEFVFTLAPLKRKSPLGEMGNLSDAIRFLKSALENYGVGAKTRAGYGWFKILSREEEDASLLNHKKTVDEEYAKLAHEIEEFQEHLKRINVDWKSVQPDGSLMAEFEGLGQKPFKKLFVDSEKLQDPVYCRTLMEVLMKGKHTALWSREKGNANGIICRKMNEWAPKFGVEL